MKNWIFSRKWLTSCLFLGASLLLTATFSSCKTGYGCPVSEQYKVKTDKHGDLSTKRGKSRLMSKKRRKRSKF